MSVQIFNKLPALKEVRVHLCPKTSTSNAAREFINKYYSAIKKSNPDLPILVRECSGIEPKIWFRFSYGKEKSVSLSKMSSHEIAQLFENK